MLAYIKDDDVAERLRARWTREQGRAATGDVNVERWADLESEIDKVHTCTSGTSACNLQVLHGTPVSHALIPFIRSFTICCLAVFYHCHTSSSIFLSQGA